MQNVRKTVISQYGNSPVLLGIIDRLNAALDPAPLIDAFYAMVWNIDTAQGWGLDVWGRIVGVSRVLQVANERFLGFDEATTLSADPFNQSRFYSGTETTTNFALSDTAFRQLILAKALANITDCSVPGIHAVLFALFGDRGTFYVADNQDMTMTVVFGFTPTPVDVSVIQTSGVLPVPPGVSVSFTIL